MQAGRGLCCQKLLSFAEVVWSWLRLKATLERVQRLAHSYTEQLLAVYPDRVQALGKGLAMDEQRLKVSPCPPHPPPSHSLHLCKRSSRQLQV